ncbi:MAG: hypothetical protein J6M57_02190, partial [Acidaminococcaceae bacterium]|nr:hypothetical protein [Acidaminococcaceae bacterium]
MKTEVVNKGSRQNVRPPDPKKPKSCTQPPAGNAITDRKDTQTAGLAELIRLYRNGSTKASLTLGDMFRPLLEKEAEKLVKANLATSPEDGLSLAILLFFEFLDVFRKTDVTDERIPSLLKKYLHDLRINKSYSTKRHCPDCYAVDFEKELADCTPFSKKFPCYEMETDDQLDARFRSR